MKTRDAVDLTFIGVLALGITILTAILATFPIIPPLVAFWICLTMLAITTITVLLSEEPIKA